MTTAEKKMQERKRLVKTTVQKIIRLIEIIWGLFLLIGITGSFEDFANISFWISFIALAMIVFVPLELLYKFVTKRNNATSTETQRTYNITPPKSHGWLESRKQQKIAQRQLAIEQSMQTHMPLQISNGFQRIHVTSKTMMYQRPDGTIYFDQNLNESYILLNYIWNGPRFDIVTKTVTTTNSKSKTKGRAGKVTGGAIVGTLLMPGIGTAVGAAAGASGKKKSRLHSTTINNDVQQSIEIPTPATLCLKNINTHEYINIVIVCNTITDSQIKCFQFMTEQRQNVPTKDNTDSIKGIKALKELLDIGAITQEEYDAKKNQLLNS